MSKTTLRMDSTQIVQFLKCPTLHNFVSVQNLTRVHEDRTAMDRGTLMHGLLERYYRKIWERDTKDQAMSYAISCLTELKQTVKLADDDYKLLALRFVDYAAEYGRDEVKIVGKDKPAIELGFSIPLLDNEDYLFVLEGRIDLLTEMSGQLVVWDHKFQMREYGLYGKSIQALNYRLATDSRIFMYNYIRGHQKKQPNTFKRESDSVSKAQLEAWKQKLIRIYFDGVVIKAKQDSIQSLSSYAQMMPDFPNQTCSDVGFGKKCPFTSVCEVESSGLKQAIIARDFFQRKEWEPWSLENGE